ncbi:MAG: DNA methyltransferase, partial [Candidatus Omnitrophota bacterium]
MTIDYKPIIAEAHTPPYKVHRYFARRPWNVFRQLIEVYSSNNEIVLDPFCGGGVTIYEGIRLHRRLVGFDINPLSIFIVHNMLKRNIPLQSLDQAFNRVREYIVNLYGDYNTLTIKSGDGLLCEKKVFIDW